MEEKKAKPTRKSISNEPSVSNNSNCYLFSVLGSLLLQIITTKVTVMSNGRMSHDGNSGMKSAGVYRSFAAEMGDPTQPSRPPIAYKLSSTTAIPKP